MAEVVFFTGVADVLDFASRLLRKKQREGERVAVYGAAPLLSRLDQSLWVAEPLDFTPHVLMRAGAPLPPVPVRERTLLWLLAEPQAQLGCETAINLGRDDLDLAALHQRVAEIVSTDPAEMAAGRARWKRHESAGHRLQHHPQR